MPRDRPGARPGSRGRPPRSLRRRRSLDRRAAGAPGRQPRRARWTLRVGGAGSRRLARSRIVRLDTEPASGTGPTQPRARRARVMRASKAYASRGSARPFRRALTEDLVDHGVERRVEHRPGIGGAPGVQVPRPFAVGEPPQPALGVQPAMGRIGIGVAGRLGPVRPLAEPPQALGLRRLQQRPLGARVHRGRIGDRLGLGLRQLAASQRRLGPRHRLQPLGAGQAATGRPLRRAGLAGQVLLGRSVAGASPRPRLGDPARQQRLGGGRLTLDRVERGPHVGRLGKSHIAGDQAP